jgi:aminodeoxyfutalosine synthase
MTTSSMFDAMLERVSAGDRLALGDLEMIAGTPDILQVGMLADAVHRSLHGNRVTYLRVALCAYDKPFTETVPLGAREVRVTGKPASLDVAVAAIEAARAVAGERAVSAFSWLDVERLAAAGVEKTSRVLQRLRGAGLDALAEFPLDRVTDPGAAIGSIVSAGYTQVRLTIDKAPADARTKLFITAAALKETYPAIRSINPLPSVLDSLRPTTGYDDVKSVAIARLAALDIPDVQVDWLRYGPKLAQVALTFGANDLDNVEASDEAPDGRRRAPLEEVRRNIQAAGFEPTERDGRFVLVG